MAIEFHCSDCGKLLSVPDGSGGRQAKCPSCGTTCEIPRSDSAPPSSQSGGPPAAGSDNPYLAPSIDVGPRDQAPSGDPNEGRDGPPWERDGKSAGTFFETVKEVFSGPGVFGRRMRRSGGLGAPMAFGVIGGSIGGLIGTGLQMIFQVGMAPGGGEEMAGVLVGMGCVVVLLPLFIILGLFIQAGITHLMLSMLGGARYDFETTFRAISYTSGSTNLLNAVPFCGGYVVMVLQIVFSILALASAQEISGGKAAAAILIPIAVCCVLGVGVAVLLIGGMAANM